MILLTFHTARLICCCCCCLQANSQSTSAREDLEKMCECLAAELVHFDYLKEKELKNILTDFVNTQQELMQKVSVRPLVLIYQIYSNGSRP